MNGLCNENTSYAILSCENLDSLISFLYAKEYQIINLSNYNKGTFNESVMIYKSCENDELRNDVIFALDKFNQESAIIKYIGDENPNRISNDGSQNPMDVIMYNTNENNISYIHNGISFSFLEKTRYWKPKTVTDLKVGMVVEYLNNNKWFEKIIKNPEEEWNKMFALLNKYEKVRIPQNKHILS